MTQGRHAIERLVGVSTREVLDPKLTITADLHFPVLHSPTFVTRPVVAYVSRLHPLKILLILTALQLNRNA
jgi:hypothetical protein